MENKININTICQKIRILSSAMINIQLQAKKTSAIIASMQKIITLIVYVTFN